MDTRKIIFINELPKFRCVGAKTNTAIKLVSTLLDSDEIEQVNGHFDAYVETEVNRGWLASVLKDALALQEETSQH